ncbi:MAG: metal-dependent transcriptional regulator [Ignavibacteria bacterium]|nr:metal-dependent transcriptional regulator [Ignavibacteria bacterium]
MPSENVEDYLKSIYAIQSNYGRVTTSSLSGRLGISAASVSEMLKKLAEDGTVHHTPYKGVELTEEGRKRAIQIIRRHRLWELFLVKVLKYEWDEIHEEAERLEHITSRKLEQRLDAALGYPRIDPHGDVIPTTDGIMDHNGNRSLANVDAGVTVTVSRVSDANPEILKYASKLGIGLRTRMVISERIDFDGSLHVKIEGKQQFISAKLAQNIFVEQIS